MEDQKVVWKTTFPKRNAANVFLTNIKMRLLNDQNINVGL